MARPRKIGLDYFPHDVDASEDEKIEALRALYGNDGYAFYFILLERIYRSDNAELDISKKAILAALIKKIGISEQSFYEMLQTCFEIGLLNKERYDQDHVLTSNGIKKRYEEVQSMRERWRKKKETSPVFPGENSEENSEENPEETGESKAKQSKANKSTVPSPYPLPNGDDAAADFLINIDDNEESGSTQNNTSEQPNPYTFYEQNFGTLSPFAAEQIKAWEDEIGPVMVVEAMKEAIRYDAKSMKYIDRIVKNYHEHKIRTPAELQRFEEKRSKQKDSKNISSLTKEAYKPLRDYNFDPDQIEKIFRGGG